MSYLKFNDTISQYGLYKLDIITDTLVKISNVSEHNLNGFKLYTTNGKVMGDYSEYKYDYIPLETEHNVFYYSKVEGFNIDFIIDKDYGYTTDKVNFYVLNHKDVKEPKIQCKENYKFLGWDKEIIKDGICTENVKYVAKFEYVLTLQDTIEKKIEQLNIVSEDTINKGTTVKFSDGTSADFEFSLYDQKNISNALTCCNISEQYVKGQDIKIPLYKKGNICGLYTPQQIFTIYITMEGFLTYNLTLQHQLSLQTRQCKTKEEVEEINYSPKCLKGEFLKTFQSIISETSKLVNGVENNESSN